MAGGVTSGRGRPGRPCNRASAYLKPNIGIDGSPLAAAIKLAQQPRRDMGKTIRIGPAWMTTNKGIVWHNGLTDGYKELSRFYGRSAAGCPVNASINGGRCRERVLNSPFVVTASLKTTTVMRRASWIRRPTPRPPQKKFDRHVGMGVLKDPCDAQRTLLHASWPPSDTVGHAIRKPQQPPPPTVWAIYNASKQTWVGEVEAPAEAGAIEKPARERHHP
jgi:hypothetical protein